MQKPHETCIDVTSIDKLKESEFVCGPLCPSMGITWDDVVAMYEKIGLESLPPDAATHVLINGEWVHYYE